MSKKEEVVEANDSALMKIVQAIAIAPEDARVVVQDYERQLRAAKPRLSDEEIQSQVIKKIISRYAKLAATTGGATALAGVIPGIGTAISVFGGSAADISACIKFQIDMTMCLAIAINKELSNEDAKHLSYLIALYGSLEQAASTGTTKLASKAGVKMLDRYLRGPVLVTIKELFQKVGITFTKTAAGKAIPFGVGVAIGASANYALTRYIGKTAVDILRIHADEAAAAAPA